MTEQIIPADDFRIGDIVRLDNGDTVEVREIVRDKAGRIIVNPGAPDELDGYVWQHATVQR